MPPAIVYEGTFGEFYIINITPQPSHFKVTLGGYNISSFGNSPSVVMSVSGVSRVKLNIVLTYIITFIITINRKINKYY